MCELSFHNIYLSVFEWEAVLLYLYGLQKYYKSIYSILISPATKIPRPPKIRMTGAILRGLLSLCKKPEYLQWRVRKVCLKSSLKLYCSSKKVPFLYQDTPYKMKEHEIRMRNISLAHIILILYCNKPFHSSIPSPN